MKGPNVVSIHTNPGHDWQSCAKRALQGHKAYSTAEFAVQQGGTVAEAAKQGTFVGASMSDEGLERCWDQLNWLRDQGSGSLRTSDVSGMDWSVAQLGALDGYCVLRGSSCDAPYRSAVTAQTRALLNSTWL